MEPALASVRFVHFAATMMMFGANVFLWAFTPPALRVTMDRRLRSALLGASLVALLSAVAWLMLEAASMGGDWALAVDLDTIRDVLTSTAFGAVWLVRLPWLALSVAVFAYSGRPAAGTVAAGAALASLALVDHASMQTGYVGVAHRINDAVHLLTTGGWLGGLPPFLICLKIGRRKGLAEDAGLAMLRFSAVGHVAVVAILLTGAVNIALTAGGPPWPPASPYRVLLIAKIAVVVAMIGLAVVNRYLLLPDLDESPAKAALLRRLAMVELALALGAVALVSYFGLLDPA